MIKNSEKVPVAKFKATCLGLFEQVDKAGRTFVVTKRGRPVARVVPVEEASHDLKGSVIFEDNIVSPTGEDWAAEQ